MGVKQAIIIDAMRCRLLAQIIFPCLNNPTATLKITGEDLVIIQETLRTGDLNIFTSRYMWLPHSGTMWLPGDDADGS